MADDDLQKNLKRIEESLAKININKDSRVQDYVDSVKNFDGNTQDLFTAYDPSFKGEDINIFTMPIVDVAKKYFTKVWSDPNEKEMYTSKFDERMQAFVDNVKSIATLVGQSLQQPNKANRTRYGLTGLSGYTPDETNSMSGLIPPKQ